jgi:3-hydroxyacyl-[acyl-carrier-protein] dehydratase
MSESTPPTPPPHVKLEMDIHDILRCLPHRGPFLMVDRVTGVVDSKLHGYKMITYNEPQFVGHFPERPVFPGVLQIEALAQLGGLYAIQASGLNLESSIVYMLGVDSVRFRRMVVPGDKLDMKAWLLKRKGPVWKMGGQTSVDGQVACELELMAYVGPKGSTPTLG